MPAFPSVPMPRCGACRRTGWCGCRMRSPAARRSAMMLRGMTARYLLKGCFTVKAGDTILIHAAAGGVGSIVCQWAKHIGATIIGTVGSREKGGRGQELRLHPSHPLPRHRFRRGGTGDHRRPGGWTWSTTRSARPLSCSRSTACGRWGRWSRSASRRDRCRRSTSGCWRPVARCFSPGRA